MHWHPPQFSPKTNTTETETIHTSQVIVQTTITTTLIQLKAAPLDRSKTLGPRWCGATTLAHLPANNTPTLPKESHNPHHLRHRTPIYNRFSRLHETHVDNHNINNLNSRNRANYNNPSQKYGNNYMMKVGCYKCGEFNHRQSTCM